MLARILSKRLQKISFLASAQHAASQEIDFIQFTDKSSLLNLFLYCTLNLFLYVKLFKLRAAFPCYWRVLNTNNKTRTPAMALNYRIIKAGKGY